MVVPREHGAWGILLIPLICGATVGLIRGGEPNYLLPFTAAALAIFWLRTPVESWLGNSPMKAHGEAELHLVRNAVVRLCVVSLAALSVLFWNGRNLTLTWFGLAAGVAFLVQAILKKSRSSRVAGELIGAAGLTSTGPSAYFLATRGIDSVAWVLWASAFLFAANQIHYVQTRIRAAKQTERQQSLVAGREFFATQVALLAILGIACLWKPRLMFVAAAFVPMLFRGFAWLLRKPGPLKIHALGWSEMRQAVAFGILLIAGVVLAFR